MNPYKDIQPRIQSIPQERIIRKMDEYMSRRDYAGAERHLKYWLEEAKMGNDRRGELLIRNELVGHFRKTGNREEALQNGERALDLLKELGFEDSVSGGTTYVNMATACNAFGENERAMELFENARRIYEADRETRAMELFENARRIYEADRETRPDLLGGLYNNMALCCTALERYDQADALFKKALAIMADVPGGGLEQAITFLNMADAAAARYGMEESESQVAAYLDKAAALLMDSSIPRDGYYAFVCEKCAPAHT